MIRRPLRTVLITLAATALLWPGAGAAASEGHHTTTHDLSSAHSVRADVNDFSYSSWDATFEVGVDEEGRATLHVEERLVAAFPEHDQNRGIVRGLPLSYRGADLDTTLLAVRDDDGAAVPYETDEDDGLLYIATGTDDYVHGPTEYVIEYEMRDVILAAEETEVDEFYWNLLPLQSTQPIDAFRAEITFNSDLSEHLTGASACYLGAEKSTDRCELSEAQSTAEGTRFTVEASDLPAGHGVTVAIALDSGTVTQPPARLPNPLADIGPSVLGGAAIALSAGSWVAIGLRARARRRGTGIVVAQFEVPESLPPLVAGAIIPGAKNPLTAQIVHLAVRGRLRIEEQRDEKAPPQLRRLPGPPPADAVDERSLKALFRTSDLLTVPKASEDFAKRMQVLVKSGQKTAAERGLTTKEHNRTARVIQLTALVVLGGAGALALWSMIGGRESAVLALVVMIIAGIVVLISTFVAFAKHTVLTREGALALEHLNGVREFIRVAEADRLRMLQSYSGAERRSDGEVDVVHLYEKLLPYAILFGQEKEWGEVLETAYSRDDTSPTWLGDGATTGFATRMLLFSTATQSASTYSAPSSSSAGGSTGGGFSGGGGGGGFSGGR